MTYSEEEGFIFVHKIVQSKVEAEEFINNNKEKNLKFLDCNEYSTLGFNKSSE